MFILKGKEMEKSDLQVVINGVVLLRKRSAKTFTVEQKLSDFLPKEENRVKEPYTVVKQEIDGKESKIED